MHAFSLSSTPSTGSFTKDSVLSLSQPVKAQFQFDPETVTYPDNLTSPRGSSRPQACTPRPLIPAGSSHAHPRAVAAPQPGKHAPESRERFPGVLGAAIPAPRSPETGAGRAAAAATSGRSPRPKRHTSRLCPRDGGALPSPPRAAHRDRSVCHRRLSARRTSNPSPAPAPRPPRRPGPSPAPPRLPHSPFLVGTPSTAPVTASAHSLRDIEGHSPRRLLPPLLLLPPLGPRPSPPPPPPPAPPSAPAPAPPAILLLPSPPPPPVSAPVSGSGSGASPGFPRRHFDAWSEQEGLGSARAWGACAALRSRPEPPPIPAAAAPVVTWAGGGARALAGRGGAFTGPGIGWSRVRAHYSRSPLGV
ncbi:uncharacterized protein LOC103010006 [Balaenoptera acutorostrata]|uniref:Uncharacterized protein LOC103010006 n=1 Tax=Balaenoptera acutorostrata TaxID=9767 RepID=A0ABM3SZD5_BALAC|nr:uncharacterized protein LOC103010006 [Balaenoptera acutorostrata]